MGDWPAFLAIGGHALYVWGAFAAGLALILIEVVLLLLRKHAILGHLGWPGRARNIKASVAQYKAAP